MNIPFADSALFNYVRYRARGEPIQSLESLRLPAIRRALVVLTTGMGDAILSTPVLPALRRAMPQAELRMFCRRAWTPLFRADADLNGVIPYHGKYRRFFGTLRKLRAFSPELAVVLHGNDPDILPLCYLAGSRHMVRIPTAGTRYGFLLSNLSRDADRATVPGWHYIENRLRILDTLGVPPASGVPRIHLDEPTRHRVAARLSADLGGRPYWVLHVYAADAYKVWPPARARQLLERALSRLPRFSTVLTGGAGDRKRLEQLSAGMSGVHNYAGTLDLAETGALLAGAACVVAPDTGVAHLAAAVGATVIGLYAPTHASLIGPRAGARAVTVIQKSQTCTPCVEKRCPYTPDNCMNQVAVDEVYDALARVLH
ncbi:MAG: glycosyltransferase family 9 protein [Betaproteobacteria bacterium]|nr:glycosyltransferase family 9 protein [Betaproteobacteria bacterium]